MKWQIKLVMSEVVFDWWPMRNPLTDGSYLHKNFFNDPTGHIIAYIIKPVNEFTRFSFE